MRYCSGNNFTTKQPSPKDSTKFDCAVVYPNRTSLKAILKYGGVQILKADGVLNMDLINKLPLEEWMEVMGNLTDEQLQEYLSKSPLKESTEPMKAIEVDYTLENEIARGCGFADELIDRWKRAGTMK